MAGPTLRIGRLARADLRYHRGGFIGVAVAIFIATLLVTGLGVLVESGIRGGLAPERYTQVDVVVGAPQSVSPSEDIPIALTERAPLPADAARTVAGLPGVAQVVGDVTVPLTQGDRVVEAHPWQSTVLTGFTLSEGREPAAADEVVVTAAAGIGMDAELTLSHGGSPSSYRVVGVVEAPVEPVRASHVFLSADRIAALDPREGEPRVLGVLTADGASADDVAAAIREAVPGLAVNTGDSRGDIEFLDSGASRAMLVTIGSAFAGTSILVAIFIVASTLSLSVQSRRRDFALLRAVGASGRQVHGLVTREVLTVAVTAALLGIGPGYLLASLLQGAFVFGGIIPGDFALAYGPIPAGAALVLVLVAAWGAAALAARRPARLDPVEALRESSVDDRPTGRGRLITGFALIAAGLSTSAVPLFVKGEYGRASGAGAAILLIIGVSVLGPWLVRHVMRLLGSALRRTSVSGFLAAANSAANSRRMASAILPLALGIGLGLVQVGAPAIVAAEAATQAEVGVTAELRVTTPTGLSGDGIDTISGIEGVEDVVPMIVSGGIIDLYELDGKQMARELAVQGVDPQRVDGALDLRVSEGALSALGGEDRVAVSTDLAQTLGVGLGGTVAGLLGDGTRLEATVVAIYERGLGFGDLTLDVEALREHTTSAVFGFALVETADGEAGTVRAALEDAGFVVTYAGGNKAAGADMQSQQGWVNLIALIVILGYIAIAVVNTLVMATAQRSRELALLQLIGASRGQVRAMMRIEAVLVAALAAVFGIAVAIPPLASMSIGISGSVLPALSPLSVVVIVGSMSALALVALWAATVATMRTRPIDEIGSRQ